VEGIVKNEWGVTSWRLATLGVGGATAIRLALSIIIEHGARPEHVVVIGVDGLGGNVFNRKLAIAFAQCASASVGIIRTLGIAIAEALVVTNELANAHVAKLLTSALLTLFVGTADGVECIHWCSLAHVTHWPIAEHETVATVGPVLALVKVGVVVSHLVDQLRVALGDFAVLATLAMLNVGGGGGDGGDEKGKLHF